MQFGSLNIEHPADVLDKIAQWYILGNYFIVQYRCYIFNSNGVIVFGNKSIPYTLFRLTIKIICIVVWSERKENEPYNKVIIPGLLDTYRNYEPSQTLLVKPRKTKLMQPLVVARVVVYITSAVVLIFVSNISFESVKIP